MNGRCLFPLILIAIGWLVPGPATSGRSAPTAETAPDSAAADSAAVSIDGPAGVTTAPDRVTFQVLLLAFDGSIPYHRIARPRATADSLAHALFDAIRAGADFDSLVREHSDDNYPGIYSLVNHRLRPGKGERPRKTKEPAVADIAFSVLPGEVDLAPYDRESCRYGWVLVKRLK